MAGDTGNRILDELPASARRLVHRTLVALPAGAQLFHQGDRITHAFFPTTAVCSLVVELASLGETVPAHGLTGDALLVRGSTPVLHHGDPGVQGEAQAETRGVELEVADRVVLMNRGRVEQHGDREQVTSAPETSFVFGFLGTSNHFKGEGVRAGVSVGGTVIEVCDAPRPGVRVDAYARPHEIRVLPAGSTHGLPAKVARVLPLGMTARVELHACAEGMPEHLEVECLRQEAEHLGARGRVVDGDHARGDALAVRRLGGPHSRRRRDVRRAPPPPAPRPITICSASLQRKARRKLP